MSDILEELGSAVIKARITNSDKYVDVLVDAGYDYEWFSGYKWSISAAGYVGASVHSFPERKHTKSGRIYLHHLILPKKKGFWITFKNGNKLDCRSANIIYRTSQESAVARPLGASTRGRTGFVGVYPYRNRKKDPIVAGRYRAKFNNRYLGVYSTPEEAARVRDKYVIENNLNSRLNYPDEIEETKAMVLHPMLLSGNRVRVKPENFLPITTPRPPIGKDYIWAVRKGEAFKILLDPEDVMKLKDKNFSIRKTGQITTNVFGEGKRATKTLMSFLLGPVNGFVKHNNGDKLDFRKDNLSIRSASRETHGVNPTTGYIGITPRVTKGVVSKYSFTAYAGATYLGLYSNAKEAAIVRDKWVKRWRPDLELNFKEGM